MKKIGQNPVLFVDSVEVDISAFKALNPFDISNISIVKPRKARKAIGDKGADGAIYVTTVQAAKQTYWTFFSGKSGKSKEIIASPNADTIVQYILNGHALSDSSAPSKLFLVTDKNFKSLDIIDKEDGRFMINNTYPKRYLVVIRAKQPKGLFKKTASK